MSKHTPGPWTVGMAGQYGTHNVNIIYAGADNSVATVYGLPMHTKLENIEPRWTEGLANARLIAAAPELLEALQEIANDPDSFEVLTQWQRDQVRAAIAKATGESA